MGALTDIVSAGTSGGSGGGKGDSGSGGGDGGAMTDISKMFKKRGSNIPVMNARPKDVDVTDTGRGGKGRSKNRD